MSLRGELQGEQGESKAIDGFSNQPRLVNGSVSICIPTCDRPGLLGEALESLVDQSYAPNEVLVGDDSSNDDAETVVRDYEDRLPIRYSKRESPKGQAENVHGLFEKAHGDLIVLLHDDDRMLPGALQNLVDCFEEHPDVVAAFGKQQVITSDGTVMWETTNGINEGYYRTAEYAGRQSSSLRSAIVQQFPNDGYMVRAEAAKDVGYDHLDAGDACDFAFGVELARRTSGDFYYLDSYTSQYRYSEQSIARGEGGDAAYHALKLVLKDLPDGALNDPSVEKWVRAKAPVAIMVAAQHGYVRDGLRWFFSRHHRHRIMTPGGIWRLACLVYSLLVGKE